MKVEDYDVCFVCSDKLSLGYLNKMRIWPVVVLSWVGYLGYGLARSCSWSTWARDGKNNQRTYELYQQWVVDWWDVGSQSPPSQATCALVYECWYAHCIKSWSIYSTRYIDSRSPLYLNQMIFYGKVGTFGYKAQSFPNRPTRDTSSLQELPYTVLLLAGFFDRVEHIQQLAREYTGKKRINRHRFFSPRRGEYERTL